MDELQEAFKEYFRTTDRVIDTLDSIITKINNHHKRCKIAKTTGTTMTVIGGALLIGGILAAPFTGGASIVAVTGFGTVSGLGGSALNVSTDVIDFVWSKSFQKDIETMHRDRESSVEHLKRKFDNVASIIKKIEDYDSSKDKDGVELFDLAAKLGYKIDKVRNIVVIASKSKNVANFGLRSGGQAWKGVRLMSKNVSSTLSTIGIDITKKTAMNIAKGGMVILTAAFVILDIKSLSESLTGSHPLTNIAEDQIRQLRNERQSMKERYDEIFGQDD